MPVKYRRRRPEEREQFGIEQHRSTGPAPGPEVLPWYWHPDRDNAQPAPAAFRKQLEAIDPDLRAVFSPVHERWLIWVKNPRIQHWMCKGWQLLFLWEHATTHAYLELNELVFHNLMLCDARRYRSASDYFDKIEQKVAAGKAAKNRTFTDERRGLQKEMLDANKISNLGTGSKSALHDDGTMVDSIGTRNWRADTRKWRLPEAILRRERDEKEQRRFGR